ncbi:hypothetical protein DFH27DRAFT_392264 [Peziza echinospora]|nr:hypothetical protein DFH27DRAFT_392264 [Peziza echinospora]
MSSTRSHREARRIYPQYAPINVSFLGKHKVKFGEISAWRNNLAALSKRYNYLFIAFKSRIHVYVPEYPSQAISETPQHILESQPTGLSGYIDQSNPHAINSITVGELGSEEVLVSAHDDGDICVWYTRDLSKIALRRNVQNSAWGVALHKEKRLLAVSANSHLIYVFDLGMGDQSGKEKKMGRPYQGDGQKEGQDTNGNTPIVEPLIGLPRGPTDATFARLEPGLVKILKGHQNNIPSISFLNHPSGNWLAGTSINGKTIVWDISRGKPVEECTIESTERGWSVLFLQPECFLPTQNVYEGTGLSTSPSHPNFVPELPDDDEPYDISPPHGRELARLQEYHSRHQPVQRGWNIPDSDSDEDEDEDGSDDDEPTLGMAQDSDFESSGDYSMSDGAEDDADSDLDITEDDAARITPDTSSSVTPAAAAHARYFQTPHYGSEGEEFAQSDELSKPPPFLLFTTSAHHAHLYEAPGPVHVVTSKYLLFSQNVNNSLHQMGHRLHLLDRLSMSCAIPELSMALTATPKGRVAIFRLTRHDNEFTMRLDDILPRDPADNVRQVPIASDEPQLPPCATMIGFAVGPIQGRELGRSRRNSEDGEFASDEGSDREDGVIQTGTGVNWRKKRKRGVWRGLEKRRRHRLMMIYNDGSVLSYELGGCSEFEVPGSTVLDGGYLMV